MPWTWRGANVVALNCMPPPPRLSSLSLPPSNIHISRLPVLISELCCPPPVKYPPVCQILPNFEHRNRTNKVIIKQWSNSVDSRFSQDFNFDDQLKE